MNRILLYIIAVILFWSAGSGAQVKSSADSLFEARKHFSFAVQNKKNGDYENALVQYEKSIALNDTVYQVHASFAELLMIMKKPERAKAEYLRTLALNPQHHASASVLAGMYFQAAAYDSALIMYETVYRIKPERSMLAGIAKMREYLGKDAEALKALQALIREGDDSRDTLLHAVKLSLKTGTADSAAVFLEKALKRNPEDHELLTLGIQTARTQGERAMEAGYLRRLALLDTTDVSVLIELGNAYRALGERKNLIWALDRHHRLAPQNAGVAGELAESLLAENESPRAEQVVKRGLEKSPKDGKLHILLGEIFRTRGETGKAKAEYRAAFDDPKWADSARQFLSRLEQPETDAEKKEREFFRRGKETVKPGK
ncbi:MAG: tetratricopeptide repeat protein [Candidatus Latescibacterota bacterium]